MPGVRTWFLTSHTKKKTGANTVISAWCGSLWSGRRKVLRKGRDKSSQLGLGLEGSAKLPGEAALRIGPKG